MINLSNYITGKETDHIKIAKKIIIWINNNIEYGYHYSNSSGYNPKKSRGALETYQNKKGVCRDFSEIMVTTFKPFENINIEHNYNGYLSHLYIQ
ncbi:hypothetical protein LCGC14_1294680 [marine sediment metagenome]|uniref:Transglutaminase-like domain-containing protein n=1 Tax=marine sediment metagenome TaxID=412755 RepID=A0A0F9NUD0_9ZZZZ